MGFSKAAFGFWLGLLLAGSMEVPAAWAQPSPASSASASASAAGPAPTQRRLPELPKAPSIELPAPKPEDLARLDDHLARLTDPDPHTRDNAQREILEVETQLVPALRFRLNKIAETEDREAMKRTLQAIRQKARDDLRNEGKGKVETPDYLVMLSQYARPKERAWVAVTRAVAISRMLERIGTVEAVRGLIDVYVRYGEFLRVDTQLALARLGDKAVPALIEARRHPAEKISSWAGRQLDALGKAIPSEAVQTTDHQVLADVLRAYGRTRDLDATRIVVSFAGTERAQVREAARQAIALLGEAANWQLRDAYENVVGKRAARDWTWDRVARELFFELDRLRSAEVDELFEKGQKAAAEGDLETARAAFDQVLARSPLFERRDEMVGAYWEYGRRFGDERRGAAIDALKRAERLSEGSASFSKIQSLRLALEAEERLELGVADRTLVRKALELDPDNERAQKLAARFARPDPGSSTGYSPRFTAAITIGVVSLLGVAWVLLRRPKEAGAEGAPEAAAAPDDSTEESSGRRQPEANAEPGAPSASDEKEASPSASSDANEEPASAPAAAEAESPAPAPSTDAQPAPEEAHPASAEAQVAPESEPER